MNKLIILAVLVASVAAVPYYQTPGVARTRFSRSGEPAQPPMPYKFDWAVKDEPSKNDYSHKQESDGKVVTGMYRVVLPDGRTQIVTYKADENGYVADVKYEGEAKYPEPSSNKNGPSKPSYY